MNIRHKAELTAQNGSAIICNVCPKNCRIKIGERGFCGTRENDDGILYAENYGKVTAAALDPIEKKPLYHFLPGTKTFSVSSYGCNFTCQNCQNYHLSQSYGVPASYISPERLIDEAKKVDAKSISFTYNEPAIWFEYIKDVIEPANVNGINSSLITNGYISEEALLELAPNLGTIRIDLKAFTNEFYRKICGAKLQPVLDTILLAKELKIHLELVTLVIPNLNDSIEEIDEMLSWETENLGFSVPHHFTKFTPMYKMEQKTETAYETLERIFRQAKDHGLYYPYLGNIMHLEGSKTVCPECGNLLILRTNYVTKIPGLSGDRCIYCGRKIEGVFPSIL